MNVPYEEAIIRMARGEVFHAKRPFHRGFIFLARASATAGPR